MAGNATRFCSIVVDQAARDILPIRIQMATTVPRSEFPAHIGDANR